MKRQLIIVNYICSINKKDEDKRYIKLSDFVKNIHPTLEYIIYENYIKSNINIVNGYNKKDELLKNNIKLLYKSENNFFIHENIENINYKAVMRWIEYTFFDKITFLDNFIENQYLKNNSKEICDLYNIYSKKNNITVSFIYKLCLEEEYMNNGFIFRKNI